MYKIEDNYKFSNAFGSIDSQLDTIGDVVSDFLTDGIKLVEDKQKMMDDMFDKIEIIDPEEAAIFDQHVYEPTRLRNIDLKNTFLSSGLSYIYSQFEFLLEEISTRSNELFESVIPEVKHKKKARRLNNGIQKTRLYLTETFNIGDVESEWEKIDNFRKIRNFFVHSNGNILRNYNIRQYIENEPNISLINDEIILTKEYIIENSTILINYLRIIMDRLYEKRKSIV